MGQGALAPSDGHRAGHGRLEYRDYTEVRVSSRSCAHLLVATSAADGLERRELRASAPLAAHRRTRGGARSEPPGQPLTVAGAVGFAEAPFQPRKLPPNAYPRRRKFCVQSSGSPARASGSRSSICSQLNHGSMPKVFQP
jgi:hypothetical protein